MNLERPHSRQQLIAIIVLLYFLPTFIVTASPLVLPRSQAQWLGFIIGTLLTCFGSIVLFLLFREKPKTYKVPIPLPVAEPTVPQELLDEKEAEKVQLAEDTQHLLQQNRELQDSQSYLQEELHKNSQEINRLNRESEFHRKESADLQDEFEIYKERMTEQLEREKIASDSYQETIAELRSQMESKQEQNDALDNKIRDLSYEIKTLLQLADMSPPLASLDDDLYMNTPGSIGEGFVLNESAKSYQVDLTAPVEEEMPVLVEQIHTTEQAHEQLKRCLNIAQKITGSHHLANYNSRFRDLGMDSYALDLRRLCDSLHSENVCTVFVYSSKENKILFVNNQIKSLLGWSPEKFVQDFNMLVQEGLQEWREGVAQLNSVNQNKGRIVMKKKTGQDVLLQWHIGLIPTGVFRNNVVGILF